MTTKAPWSMIKSGELPAKFWVVTITRTDNEGNQLLSDVRAYMTETGARYFYGHTLKIFERHNRYQNNYFKGAVVTLTEYQADDGTVLKTFTNAEESK